MEQRERVIVRVSLVGIGLNILLAGFKALVGMISHSIAYTVDAVNNLTDILSSVVTIVGAKLGAKKPDREHPHGHGRIEYVSSLIVAFIIIYAGVTALIESIQKIIHPVEVHYDTLAIVVICVSVVVKIFISRYFKTQGRKVDSSALTASGADALMDVAISLSVLASAVLYIVLGWAIEAYVGVFISLFIIKSGVGVVSDSVSDIIGSRSDARMSRRIKELLCEAPEVRGAYDLNLFNY
ncbi:MAG: cation transporter, partial [Paludibacteraceae bacterium]|nr:cation transporter [Paludibacteraceae bacterium]